MGTDRQKDDKGQIDVNKEQVCSLILHNDDYHSFDFVIDALVKICGMDIIQATQCTYLVHFKENCEVKQGKRSDLLPFQQGLLKLDLKAEIR